MKIKALLVLSVLLMGVAAQARVRIGVSLGYSPNYMANLTGTGFSGLNTGAVSMDLDAEGVLDLGLHVWSLPEHSFGFISGFNYSGERKVTKGKVNGSSFTAGAGAAKFQTQVVYLGSAYRWQSFYIPFAISYGFTSFALADTAPPGTKAEVKGGVGALLGLGWYFTENFSIEYVGRSSAMTMDMSSSSEKVWMTGMSGSALLSLKYFF